MDSRTARKQQVMADAHAPAHIEYGLAGDKIAGEAVILLRALARDASDERLRCVMLPGR